MRKRIAAGAGLGVAILLLLFSLPREVFHDPYSTVLEDAHGVLMGARISADGQWRFPPKQDIPRRYKISVIEYEDRYFYSHPGVNLFALGRALMANIHAGDIVSGGSTISMQVIRLSRRNRPRTVGQKLAEILLALRLELRCSKEAILAMYAAHAPFGGNVVGLEAASWRYYGRSPEQLSWAEAATLAVLPNAPSLIYPGKNQELLLAKRNRLLDRLRDRRFIDAVTCSLAKEEPLPGPPLPLPDIAPHLLSRIMPSHQGQRIVTTLDGSLQERVNSVLESHHKILSRNEIHNAAALVMETESGRVLAYSGNTRNAEHPEHGGEVDIIRSRRSTGSILKPALFAASVDQGMLLPASLLPDIPVYYSGFSPKNFNLEFAGAVPARQALTKSLNVPSVIMLQQYNPARFLGLLKKLGLKSVDKPADHYGLSLILGGAESSLWELSGMYSSLSRILVHYNQWGKYFADDVFEPWILIQDIPGGRGPRQEAPSPLLSAASIWITMQSLLEVNRPDSETGWEYFHSSRKIAWKTGTSFGYRDAWSIGTTPEFLVAVWAGNADGEGRPGLTGSLAAAPVMFEIFQSLPQTGWYSKPFDELYPLKACRESGYLAGQYCPETDTLFVPEACLESPPCPYHVLVHLDVKTGLRVHKDCHEEERMAHQPWFVLPPVMEWYYKTKNPSYRNLPSFAPGCVETGETPSLDLVYPRENASVYIPVELDGSRGSVVFEAAHRKKQHPVFWHLDEKYIGTTSHIHQMTITAQAGPHKVTLVDESGEILVRNFLIVDRNTVSGDVK